MNKSRRTGAVVLACLLIFLLLAGCGLGGQTAGTDSPTAQIEPTAEETTTPSPSPENSAVPLAPEETQASGEAGEQAGTTDMEMTAMEESLLEEYGTTDPGLGEVLGEEYPLYDPEPAEMYGEPEKETEAVLESDGRIKYIFEEFTLYLPASWDGLYIMKETDTGAQFYNASNYDAGFEGYLFGIECTEKDLSLQNATFVAIANRKYLWMTTPSDLQYNTLDQELTDEYRHMQADLEVITAQIKANPDPEEGNYKYETVCYAEGRNCVYYPQFTDLGAGQEGVNALIKDYIFQRYDRFKHAYSCRFYYRVEYNRGGLISVVFDAYGMFDGTESRPLYSINIDVEKQEVIRLADMIDITPGFVELLREEYYDSERKFYSCIWPDADLSGWQLDWILEDYGEKSVGTWVSDLAAADGDENGIMTYFTKAYFVVSIPAKGTIRHLEVKLFYNRLGEYSVSTGVYGYRTDSEEWNLVEFPKCSRDGTECTTDNPVTMDFDGDGTEETFSVEITPTDETGFDEFPIDCIKMQVGGTIAEFEGIISQQFYIADLDENDPYLDIIVMNGQLDVSYYIDLYRYDGERLYQYGGFYIADYCFFYNGKGMIYFYNGDIGGDKMWEYKLT